MTLSKPTWQKLVELVAALEKEIPNLDLRARCGVLRFKDGELSLKLRNLTIEELEPWFWSMVKRNEQTNCWEWMGLLSSKGYGVFKTKGRIHLASRTSLIYVTGTDSSLCACHRCDNPKCVNPFHLFRGTHADNMWDMQVKGRKPSFPSEINPNAKLNRQKVYYLRTCKTKTLKLMAKELGIDYHYAWKVRAGWTWKNNGEEL